MPLDATIGGVNSNSYVTASEASSYFNERTHSVTWETVADVDAALITASTHHSRDVAQLLTHLAECSRSECELYLRIWVSRARTRTSVRIISVTILCFALGLFLFNMNYLRPFFSREGSLVFLVVGACFGSSLYWMSRIARVEIPGRLLSSRSGARS